MHADHAARGVLKSGGTIKAAIQIAEKSITDFARTVLSEVADVAQDIAAFGMIMTDVTIAINDLKRGVDDSVELAVGKEVSSDRMRSASDEAARLLLDLQQRTLRLVEIQRISFTRPSPGDMGGLVRPNAVTQPKATRNPLQSASKNKGGKPLAAHWDAMWADIAVQLYVGDLKPKSQKQVKDAMFAWFNAASIAIGDTAVTERARQLWLKLEAAK